MGVKICGSRRVNLPAQYPAVLVTGPVVPQNSPFTRAHTHTHTHRERERERERQTDRQTTVK